MSKWRLLVGVVSTAQLLWGIFEFVKYSRSVGATADPTGTCVYLGLGLLGLLVLAWPRFGIPIAVTQGLAALYALCWLACALALIWLLTFLGTLAGLMSPPSPSMIASAVGQAGGLPNLWQVGWVAEPMIKPPPPSGLPALARLILITAGATALSCMLSAVGTWQVARRTSRSSSRLPSAVGACP
jgi:hypothetical protein